MAHHVASSNNKSLEVNPLKDKPGSPVHPLKDKPGSPVHPLKDKPGSPVHPLKDKPGSPVKSAKKEKKFEDSEPAKILSATMSEVKGESSEIENKLSKIGDENVANNKKLNKKPDIKNIDSDDNKATVESDKEDDTGKKAKKKKDKKSGDKKKQSGEEGDKKLRVRDTKNEDDLATKLKDAGSNLVVIDFFAKWCGPCKMISPKIEELAKEYPDVVFLKVDVDECEEIATTYEISSMPTFLFIKNGNTLQKFSGANYEKLKETLLQHK